MRGFAFFLTGRFLLSPIVVMANTGQVSVYLSSPDDNGPKDRNPAAGIIDYGGPLPSSVPVEVKFSATTNGPDGPNSGVFGIGFDLTGTSLGNNTGRTMNINDTFKNPMGRSNYSYYNPRWYGPYGCGFNGLIDTGTGQGCHGLGEAGIFGFGASQVQVGGQEDFAHFDAQFVGHLPGTHPTIPYGGGLPLASNQQYAGAVGPVLAFTGDVVIDEAGTIELYGAANVWALGGRTSTAAGSDTDTLVIVPEPASVLLAAFAGLLLMRRGRPRRTNKQRVSKVVHRALLIAVLLVTPAFAWPKEWRDDFKTAATYDSASLYAPCFGGPSTKYTMINLATKAVFNERAVCGNGSLVFTNRSTAVIPEVSRRLELAVIGVVDVDQPCPDNPVPSPGASYVTSEPFTSYPNNICAYGGVMFTPWQLRHAPDSQSIRGPDGKCGVADVDDDLDGTTDENDECLAARPTPVNSGYGNPDGTGFRGGRDAAPGVAGIDDDENGIIDDLDELGWPTSDDGDDTNRQGYGIAMDANLARNSLIYVGMDPADVGDEFSMRHVVAGADFRLEASNEIPQGFYEPYIHYNWVFCSGESCYGAILWTGTDLANPNETLGPLVNTNHTAEADNVVAHMFFMRTTPPQFIRRQHIVGNSSFDHTFWVESGGTWFYFPSATADLDRDKDVDGFDFLTFSKCYNGSKKPPLSTCTNPQADLDEDGDVDVFDFLTFSNCYNASNRKPQAACFPPNLTTCGS